MFKALDIANFYIQLSNSIPEDSIDNLKLNKLLYYVQGRALAELGRPLFDDNIEAWDFGPVIPSVFHTYKCCGKNSINAPADFFDESRLTTEELNVLIDVYLNYGKYTGSALMRMTHVAGTPWDQVYVKGANNVITQKSIKEYFISNDNFEPFKLNYDDNDVITAIPSCWDSDEDSVYDEV